MEVRGHHHQITVMECAVKNDKEKLIGLLSAGFSHSPVDTEGFTALHKAAALGHAECMVVLMDAGADPRARSNTGWTPLHKAADSGHASAVALLLSRGADALATTDSDKTALARASARDRLECVRELTLSKANRAVLNVRDKEGFTAFHRAVERGVNEEIVVLLGQELMADVNIPSLDGTTPFCTAVKRRDFRLMRRLKDLGADVDASDRNGWTATHFAAEFGEMRLLRWVINDAGGSPMKVSKDGETPLHRAARGGNLACVTLLVNHGAFINAKNKEGWAPAHYAAWAGAEEVVKFLGGRGAQLDSPNKDGWTPNRMMPGVKIQGRGQGMKA
jgi:ankyrin repeat protein